MIAVFVLVVHSLFLLQAISIFKNLYRWNRLTFSMQCHCCSIYCTLCLNSYSIFFGLFVPFLIPFVMCFFYFYFVLAMFFGLTTFSSILCILSRIPFHIQLPHNDINVVFVYILFMSCGFLWYSFFSPLISCCLFSHLLWTTTIPIRT